MHAPKNRNSLGNLLEPFAVGLQSWANICIIDYICLYYSHFLVHWQAPKGSFPLNPHFGRPGSPGTATEEPKSPLWWPTSMVTSTPCERTWWWSLWLDGHCPTWVVSWYLHTLDTWIVFCFLDELSLNSRARYATLSWFMLKLSSKKTGAVRWQHVKYGLAHADVPLWQGLFLSQQILISLPRDSRFIRPHIQDIPWHTSGSSYLAKMGPGRCPFETWLS
jgi:hypothetical protein